MMMTAMMVLGRVKSVVCLSVWTLANGPGSAVSCTFYFVDAQSVCHLGPVQ